MKKTDHINLIYSLKEGHTNAYSFVYKAYYQKLNKYVYSLCQDRELTEDIVQDVLMKLWINRKKLTIHTSLNAYLYKCAFNDFVNKSKLFTRRSALIEELRIEAIRDIESCSNELDEERLLYLQSVIENLPPKRKEIFILNKLKKYKYKEIALLQNISERTVESQIRKAMLSLKQEVLKYKTSLVILLFLQ